MAPSSLEYCKAYTFVRVEAFKHLHELKLMQCIVMTLIELQLSRQLQATWMGLCGAAGTLFSESKFYMPCC